MEMQKCEGTGDWKPQRRLNSQTLGCKLESSEELEFLQEYKLGFSEVLEVLDELQLPKL